MFRSLLLGIAHAPFDVSNRCYLDNVFSQKYFPLESVTLEQMAPLQAMNAATLDRLLYVLKPKIWGSIIDTKAAFDQITVAAYDSHIDSIGGRVEACSLEQMASYQLHKAVMTEPVHWGQMVDLYNNATADQQEAIHQFFLHNYNRQLDVILATPAPDVTLPESLRKTFDAKTENGETFFYSEVAQKWFNEAALQQIYSVTAKKNGSANPEILIATAATVEEVIAFATIFTQGKHWITPVDRITIHHSNNEIAVADIVFSSRDPEKTFPVSMKYKLDWDLKKAGASTTNLKTFRDEMATEIESCNPEKRDELEQKHREMCRLIHSCSSDTPEAFTKAVLAVERTLGVQWSKVSLLEDALGL
jgi:hypothetical protein